MGIFEWGEKRFARGIAKAMIRSYKLLNNEWPSLSEVNLIKLVLSTRPGRPARQLFYDIDNVNFWSNVAGETFAGIIYLLVCMEYAEYMKGSLDAENRETNQIFKKIIDEEIEKEIDIN